jgi:hypothetical protein
MLWSLSGNLSIVYSVLFGMNYEVDRLCFAPFVPRAMAGIRTLTGFPYRNATLDITVEGYGSGISAFYLDGEPARAEIPAALEGSHAVRIVLDKRIPQSQINMVQNAYSPDTPVCIVSGNMLNWEACNGAKAYRIIYNGKPCSDTKDTFFEMGSYGEYQVIALGENGYESFASEPVNYANGNLTLIPLEGMALTAKGPYTQYDGGGYLPLSLTENRDITIAAEVPGEGDYSIDFLYANANGPINTNNRCAIRTLWDGSERLGVLVLPQCGDDAWNVWKYSHPRIVHLKGGHHDFRLTFEDENNNMNIDINSAAISKMRLIKVTLK